jgi:uncharacterized protein YkwD
MPHHTVPHRLATAAALAFGSLSSLPAVAAACSDAGPGAVVCEINRERRERDLRELRPDARLARAADGHAEHMVQLGYFSHVTPAGKTVADRLRSAGYLRPRTAWSVGEVLAWGQGVSAAPGAIVSAWMRSPPHRRVLLGRAYEDVGVGVQEGDPFGAGGRTYAAELGHRS